MSLPAKKRFKEVDIKDVLVSSDENNVPYQFHYSPEGKGDFTVFEVLGISKEIDLIPKSLPLEILTTGKANQYVVTDLNGEIYNAYIYGIESANGMKYYLGAMKSIPHKK